MAGDEATLAHHMMLCINSLLSIIDEESMLRVISVPNWLILTLSLCLRLSLLSKCLLVPLFVFFIAWRGLSPGVHHLDLFESSAHHAVIWVLIWAIHIRNSLKALSFAQVDQKYFLALPLQSCHSCMIKKFGSKMLNILHLRTKLVTSKKFLTIQESKL